MEGLTGTGSSQGVLEVLGVFLGFVSIVGWLVSTISFWFLFFEFLAFRKKEPLWYVVIMAVYLVCLAIFSVLFFYSSIAFISSFFGLTLPGSLTSLLYRW